MKKKLKLLQKKFELTAMAVTYAEAGEWDVATDYLDKVEKLNQSKKPKMMVVALNSAFLDETAEYTVNLAERMKYDVLAVNAIQSKHSNSLQKLKKNHELPETLKRIFSSVVERAQSRKIRCETFITTSDLRSLVKQLLKQVRRVEVVFVQVERGQNFTMNLEVPVYQIQAGKA